MRTVRSAWSLALVGAVGASLITGCGGASEPRLEASPYVGAVGAASPTQSPIATAHQADTRDLYVVDPKTGATIPLLSAPGIQGNAEVSPDGERAVFESRAPGEPSQIHVVDLLDPEGTTRQLTRMKHGASDPTWSPDGTRIAFAGTRRRSGDPRPDTDIFVMNADGSGIRRFAGTPKDDGLPDWSPDGSLVAFQSGFNVGAGERSDIWLASVPDGTRTLLDLHFYPWGGDPEWSPDGRWIAYSRFAPGTLNGEIPYVELLVVRPDGTQQHRIDDSDGPYGEWRRNPSWSSNGRSIVVQGRTSVGIIDVESGDLRNILVGTPTAEPTWGPGGIAVSLTQADAAAMPQATVQTGWGPTWEPSWAGRPDATVVRCGLNGDANVIDPGMLTLEFVNESHHEATFKVVRLRHGRRPADLQAGPSIGGGWGDRSAPSATDIWSSPRAITSGRWVILCWKDLIDSPRGLHLVPVGIAGPFEIG
jgi:TolB protein